MTDLIESVVEESVWADFESMPEGARDTLVEIFEDNLSQPQGWSLSSLSEDLHQAFNVPVDDAELVARTETASIMNEAREEGYRDLGVDDAVFRWIGPADHRTTDACEWMKEVTYNGPGDMVAQHGEPESIDTVGEPVPLDDLIALEREAAARFFPDLDYRKHVLHPNERHTFVESFVTKMVGEYEDEGAGGVAFKAEFDISPAVGGTYAVA